jgi:death-on-curing protein
MTAYLDLDSLLVIAERATGAQPQVRDYGLMESSLARPRTTVFGAEAYPTLAGKAAATLHSLAPNHALVDGNNRLAWHATAVFLYVNDVYLDAPDDEAYDLVVAIASGLVHDLKKIAGLLEQWFSDIR